MLSGLNHITLAVQDLGRSIDWYQRLLGLKLHARWDRGAYLSAGELWLCLSLDATRQSAVAADYTHFALSVAGHEFDGVVRALRAAGVVEWQANTSEGASFYFLDADGYKLEIHVGGLAERLRACRLAPYSGMEFFD